MADQLSAFDVDATEEFILYRCGPELMTVIGEVFQRLRAAERAGQELWVLCMKYGLKHRPLCVMTAKPNGNECSCGLAEETYAVMDRVRLTKNMTTHKAGK